MPELSSYQRDLIELKNKVINIGLLAFSVMALIIHGVSFLRDLEFGVTLAYKIQTVGVAGVVILAIFRNKLSLGFKITSLVSIILLTIVTGLNSMGFLASATIYIAITPFLISIIYSYRQAFAILCGLTLIYVVFGFLYINEVITYSIDIVGVANSLKSWILDAIIIFMTSWAVLLVGYNFNKRLEANVTELRDYKENLEELVSDKTEKLESTNAELQKSNDELQATLDSLRDAQEQLINAEKMASLGVLTAGVAHEINNPLNFISGGYYGIKAHFADHPEQLNEDVDFFLKTIKEGVERSGKIVEGLNHFSRTNQTYDEECNINEVIENCLLILRNRYKKTIEIKKNLSESIPVITGNDGKLHQAVLNIFNNAIQAIDGKGVIEINTSITEESIRLMVKDSGAGISPDIITKITDPFFTTKEPGEGTGLGLSITKKILDEHHAIISYDSVENEGTTCTVLFKSEGMKNER
jgi:signal transduction histidine kinase